MQSKLAKASGRPQPNCDPLSPHKKDDAMSTAETTTLETDSRTPALRAAGLTDADIASIFSQDDRGAPPGAIVLTDVEAERLVSLGLEPEEVIKIGHEHRALLVETMKVAGDSETISFLEENQPELAALIAEDPEVRRRRLNKERQTRWRRKHR